MCGHSRFVAVIVIGLIGVLGANARVAAQEFRAAAPRG